MELPPSIFAPLFPNKLLTPNSKSNACLIKRPMRISSAVYGLDGNPLYKVQHLLHVSPHFDPKAGSSIRSSVQMQQEKDPHCPRLSIFNPVFIFLEIIFCITRLSVCTHLCTRFFFTNSEHFILVTCHTLILHLSFAAAEADALRPIRCQYVYTIYPTSGSLSPYITHRKVGYGTQDITSA